MKQCTTLPTQAYSVLDPAEKYLEEGHAGTSSHVLALSWHALSGAQGLLCSGIAEQGHGIVVHLS